MNCHEVRQHWNLYHDSEGEAELHFQVNEHLAMCPACAEWFAQQSRLESLLAEKVKSSSPTPELWDKVLKRAGLKRPTPARRWQGFALAACVAVVVIAGLWYGHHLTIAGAPDLAQLTAERHRQLAGGDEVMPFRSDSDLDVEAYLRQRVNFPVRCPPRKDSGFLVRGAGTCTFGNQPAAYLCGAVEDAPVSIFLLPRDSLAVFPHQRDAVIRKPFHRCREGDYEMVLAAVDRNAIVVVGQLEPARLEKVLLAYGTYPDHE